MKPNIIWGFAWGPSLGQHPALWLKFCLAQVLVVAMERTNLHPPPGLIGAEALRLSLEAHEAIVLVHLRGLCRKRGLSQSGRKEDMVARLKDAPSEDTTVERGEGAGGANLSANLSASEAPGGAESRALWSGSSAHDSSPWSSPA